VEAKVVEAKVNLLLTGAIQHSQGVIMLYLSHFRSDRLGKVAPWKLWFISFEWYQTRAGRTRIAPSRTFLLHISILSLVFFEFLFQFWPDRLGKVAPGKLWFISITRYQIRAYRTRIALSKSTLSHNPPYPPVFFKFLCQLCSKLFITTTPGKLLKMRIEQYQGKSVWTITRHSTFWSLHVSLYSPRLFGWLNAITTSAPGIWRRVHSGWSIPPIFKGFCHVGVEK
jgi:hypothetical protein